MQSLYMPSKVGGLQISSAIANPKFADSKSFLTLVDLPLLLQCADLPFAEAPFLGFVNLRFCGPNFFGRLKMKIRKYIISLLKMLLYECTKYNNFTLQTSGKFFLDFAMKRPKKAKRFVILCLCFIFSVQWWKILRICNWRIKKSVAYDLLTVTLKKFADLCMRSAPKNLRIWDLRTRKKLSRPPLPAIHMQK